LTSLSGDEIITRKADSSLAKRGSYSFLAKRSVGSSLARPHA
jgi:hypothetical protein